MINAQLITSILLILASAWLLGNIFARLGLPQIMGELLAGLILGPPILGWIQVSPSLELMADFGIFFVMFYTGMELNPRDLFKNLWPALATALAGFAAPFVLGFLTARLFGGTTLQSLFVGLGISITAIAVQSVVLQSLRINKTDLGHIIIGAAVVDDVLSLIGLSVLFGLARTGNVHFGDIALALGKVVGFFAAAVLIGEFLVPILTRRLSDQEGHGFTFAMLAALAMAELAELAGLHLIIGAFVAGQFIRREWMDPKIYEAIADRFYGITYGFLMPIFFVSLSFHLHIHMDAAYLLFVLALTAAAIVGKVVGCGGAAMLFGHNYKEGLIIGFGMNGRGAVELVVASVVAALSAELVAAGRLGEPLLTQSQFSALVIMAFVTTLLAPLTLKWAVLNTCDPGEGEDFCRLLDQAPRR